MARFLAKASYTPEGTKGLMKEGGTSRKENLERLIKEVGGTVESFYFAFGEADVIVLLELPDNTTAASLSMTINSTGLVQLSITPLLTAEEIDSAAKKRIGYRAPGQ